VLDLAGSPPRNDLCGSILMVRESRCQSAEWEADVPVVFQFDFELLLSFLENDQTRLAKEFKRSPDVFTS
jgi:hypothetical protein